MIRSSVVFLFICFLPAAHPFAQEYRLITTLGGHHGGITALTKDLQDQYLIAGDDKGYLYFHELNGGQLVSETKAHGAPVSQLRFNSTGRLLISATYDGEIKIYDFVKQKIIQSIYSPDYSGIRFVLFSIADGFVYFNGNNRLFKTRSDLTQPVYEVLSEKDTIRDAVISHDRSSLIYATGGFLKVLNTRSDQLRQEFNTGLSQIENIALINDSIVATWSRDGTLFFWHYFLGQLDPTPVFFMKAGSPAPLGFSADGSLLCTGNIGTWARIWKPWQRSIVQELFGHTKTVTSTCFGISGNSVYTGSLDGTINLWQNDTIPAPTSLTDSLPPVTESKDAPGRGSDSTEGIVINEQNIPSVIFGRTVVSNQRVEINAPTITIFVYDNSYNDGDTMSLFFNGRWILDHYGVTKVKKEITLGLAPNTNNYLVLFANNLGRKPPNTAAIEFMEGNTKKIFRLSSDLKNCSAINFYYKK